MYRHSVLSGLEVNEAFQFTLKSGNATSAARVLQTGSDVTNYYYDQGVLFSFNLYQHSNSSSGEIINGFPFRHQSRIMEFAARGFANRKCLHRRLTQPQFTDTGL